MQKPEPGVLWVTVRGTGQSVTERLPPEHGAGDVPWGGGRPPLVRHMQEGEGAPPACQERHHPPPPPIPQAAELLLRGRDAVLAEGCTVHLVVPTPQSGIPSRVT